MTEEADRPVGGSLEPETDRARMARVLREAGADDARVRGGRVGQINAPGGRVVSAETIGGTLSMGDTITQRASPDGPRQTRASDADPLAVLLMALSLPQSAGYSELRAAIIRAYGAGYPKLGLTLGDYADDPETYRAPMAKLLREVGVERNEAIVDRAADLLKRAEQIRPGISGARRADQRPRRPGAGRRDGPWKCEYCGKGSKDYAGALPVRPASRLASVSAIFGLRYVPGLCSVRPVFDGFRVGFAQNLSKPPGRLGHGGSSPMHADGAVQPIQRVRVTRNRAVSFSHSRRDPARTAAHTVLHAIFEGLHRVNVPLRRGRRAPTAFDDLGRARRQQNRLSVSGSSSIVSVPRLVLGCPNNANR